MSGSAAVGGPFEALRSRLLDAAGAVAGGPDALAGILTGIVDDVDRALREELEIFPVCHHSPASALAMAQRLREKQPRTIYLEMCEDLRPLLDELRNCRPPVALQAYATDLDGFPEGAGPLSVVAPMTESSAEYQAIAYALTTPGVELVAVDRSADHVFQWMAREDGSAGVGEPEPLADAPADAAEHGDDLALHGESVGIEIGDLRPGFAELEAYLLHHGKVRHWSEWWDQYVEQPMVGAGYDTYRQILVLIGSLFRRLRPARAERLAVDEDRERYMWTRIRQHLSATGADPARAMYVCGAFHAASRVEEFGLHGRDGFEVGERSGTAWLYGLIPSSHSAIEAQFGLAPGSVSIASATWEKAVASTGARPYRLEKPSGKAAKPKKTAAEPTVAVRVEDAPTSDRLSEFLGRPAVRGDLDEAELLGWCVDIVRLARQNGYLSSTADAIAVYETSILLAGIRDRSRPTPYDFQDAAVTCIEKDVVPGRRDVRRLCEILLGGDRIGQVGYDSLPPLAQDVYRRLAPLGVSSQQRTKTRALLNLDAQPELRTCSDLLWMLHHLLPDGTVTPIMGSRKLGERAAQESWDIGLGRDQRALIELGYEGVTVEQVLEQRLRKAVWRPDATAATALAAVEDSIVYLRNPRFTDELGARAVELLSGERSVDGAPEVLRRIRALLAYYRTTRPALPGWTEEFVRAGYAHYCTLLPTAFAAEDSGVRQVAAMAGFLFTLESLALSLGCDRSQLELAVRQSHPEEPSKVALWWGAQLQLGLLSMAELRSRCDALLGSPLTVEAFPHYLGGFVQALDPVPRLAPLVVEVLSQAFARMPDALLLPWLPKLITTLRAEAGELVPLLVREAGRTFPGTLPQVDAYVPPWSRTEAAPAVSGPVVVSGPVPGLLAAYPAALDAVAELLGAEGGWAGPGSAGSASGAGSAAAEALLAAHPLTAEAVAELLV